MARSERPIVIVGGGLAGMSAALTLHEAGRRVLLLERRALPGGRAGSFLSPTMGGAMLDNSQHVLVGCCRELLQFYERLGVRRQIRFDPQILFSDPCGRRASMQASLLPAPLHLLPSLMGFSILPVRQRVEVIRGMLQIAAISPAERWQYASQTMAALLRQWGQSPSTIERFWDVICVSALNEPCESAAGHFGLHLFQEAFLGERSSYQMGLSQMPLSRLYARLPFPSCMGRAAARVELAGGRAAAVMAGERIECEAVIIAVHPTSVQALLPQECMQQCQELRKLSGLSYAPIIGAHLLYDRRVLDVPAMAMVGTRLQWIFADSENPCLLHGVISAPGELADEPREQLEAWFDSEVRQVCPPAVGATLKASVIVKEKQATFRSLPGVEAFRPCATTSIPGVYLAGDYTRTGWPATMEGAVISGRLAAEAVLQ